MESNVIVDKSFCFAKKIVIEYKNMSSKYNDYVLLNQILRSGTSIGANVTEAIYAQSEKDFVSRMNIALKEASETEFWLELLIATNYISIEIGKELLNDCIELKRILHSIVKTSRSKFTN